MTAASASTAVAPAAELVLSNGCLRVSVDPGSGVITRCVDETRGVELVQEPLLANNFRLLVPLPALRGHYIEGREQHVSDVISNPGGTAATLTYRELTSAQGRFDIVVTLTLQLEDDDLRVTLGLVNNSGHTVEEATVCIGGIDQPDASESWRVHHPDQFGKGREWAAFSEFPGTYLGPSSPVWLGMYHGGLCMPWLDLYDRDARVGVMLASLDPRRAPAISAAYAELKPHGIQGRNPRSPEFQDWPARTTGRATGLTLGWTYFPFLAPGSAAATPTTVWHFHDGTWWQAAQHYRAWFLREFPEYLMAARTWLPDADAWQSTIISYPDDRVGYSFRELPRLAAEALAHGIRVLQIDGWDVGGIDRDYPDYTPDPRLGTVDELKAAIRACQALGCRVLLFVNLQWANLETAEYAEHLHGYSVKDPRGITRNSMGWEYHTSAGLLEQCESRVVMMNPSHAGFRALIVERLVAAAALGADGFQIDKLGTVAEFDYSAPDGDPAASVTAGVMQSLHELASRVRTLDPDFAFAAETHWDRSLLHCEASYARFFSRDHLPTAAVAFPEFRQTVCVTGDDDLGLVNNAVRFAHVINVEAHYLHGGTGALPRLGRYLEEILRLRHELREALWYCRVAEPVGVDVRGDVFFGRLDGVRSDDSALVLNHFSSQAQRAVVAIDGVDAAVLHRPFCAPEERALPTEITLPPDEVAILIWRRPQEHGDDDRT